MRSLLVASVIALCMGVSAAAGAAAPTPPTALQPAARTLAATHPALAEKWELRAPWTRVARSLREIVAGVGTGSLPPGPAVTSAMRALGLRADQASRVHVTVRVSSLTGEESALLRARGLDVTFESATFRFVEGWAAVTAVEDLAALDFVESVRPTLAPLTSTGSVLSQGDAILRADQARQTFGVSGQGVTVGVLSDSVDGLGTAVASADLPPDVQVLKAGQGEGEGTAMLEIVHDLAPGASLAFYGPGSSGDMITGITQLAAAGARVIVDDLTFFDQPHFEEGPIAQTVDALAAQGVVYVTSSGNFASANGDRGHYEALFDDGGTLTLDDGGTLTLLKHVHRFASGVVAQSIVVLPGSLARIFLQWADPFGQAGDDYDLYVTDQVGTVIAKSDDPQDGNGFPIEAVVLDGRNLSSPAQVFVVINLFAGVPRQLEAYYAGGITAISPATPGGSIAGHGNATGAITVGTINAGDPGNVDIAPYSSQGPCEVFFPVHELRPKPEITGIDGVSVTGAAGFPNPFFGTSAAAPHIAALAALIRQANLGLSPAAVKQALQSTAVDLGTTGFDTVFGSGRADGLAAVSAVVAAPASSTTTTTTIGVSTTIRVTTTIGVTTTTLPPTPPSITALSAVLDGNVLQLSATAVDPDADVASWRATIYDQGGASLGNTGFVAFSGALPTEASVALQLTGLEEAPTAASVGLVLQDATALLSDEVRADFGQGDSGGPRITSVVFRAKARRLLLVGSGFVRRGTFLELNGTASAKAAKVNKARTRATIQGSAGRLNLRSGANRVRLLVGGLRSNIVVLDR
jgi:Subtilase family